MHIALEMGDRKTAAMLAARYLERQSAWLIGDSTFGGSIYALGVQYRAGTIDRATFGRARDRWLATETLRAERSGSAQLGFLWVIAFAMNVVTSDDAREALDLLPRYAPLPSAIDIGLFGAEPIGETYRLADRRAEAREWLSRAASSFQPVEYPLFWVQAKLALGRAEEAAGNIRAACDAYSRALYLWGSVTQSVTAAIARRRADELGCSAH